MAITKDSLVATIEIQTGSSSKNLKELKGQLEGNATSLTVLEKTLESLNKSISNLENIVGKFGKALSGQQKEIKVLENTANSIQQTNTALVGLSQSTQNLSNSMSSSLQKTNSDMGGFNQTLLKLKENLVFVGQIGLTGVVLAGANASNMFKGLGTYLKSANINFLNLYEGAAILSAALGTLALTIGHTDSDFMSLIKTVAIAGSVITGSFALKSHILLTVISQIAYGIGTTLVDAMSQWEKQSAKAAEITRQFIFTLKGFGDVFGTDVIGSLEQWQTVIAELVQNTTFSTQQMQKAVKILVAEGKAFGLSYKTNVDLLKRSVDIAASSGLEIEDVVIRIAQALSGNSQSLIALGINISDAALAHSKYVLASEKTVSQLTDQEKTQLRLNEIMDRTIPIMGAAEYQTKSIIGSQKQLDKAVNNLTIKLGEQSSFLVLYNRVLSDVYTSFVKLPEPILDSIGVIIDFGGVFLKIAGTIGQYLTIVLGVVTAHKLLNVILMQSATIQALSVITLNKINALFKLQAVAVVTATTLYSTLTKIIGISLIGAFASLLSLIKSVTIAIYASTVALLSNPLFWKAIVIAGAIFYLVKAIKNVSDSMSLMTQNTNISISPMKYLVDALEKLRLVFLAVGSTVEDVFTASISGLVSTVLIAINSLIKLYKAIVPPDNSDELNKFIETLDINLANVSRRGTQSLNNLQNRLLGNSEALAQVSANAMKTAESFDLAAISASKLEKSASGIDKAAIQLAITGDEADRLNITLKESADVVKTAGDLFIKTEGTKKEYLDQYIEGLKNQYKAEAQIAKFKSDSLNDINKLTKSYTIDQLRSSGQIIEAIKLEYAERRKDLNERVSLLQKIGGINTKQLKDVENAQKAVNVAQQAEIDNYLNKQKEEALKKVEESLKSQQQLLQDIETKNGELNRTIAVDGVTAREAINAQLEYQLSLVDQNIERSSILYGENSAIVQALEKQKQLLQDQAKIDLRKLLPIDSLIQEIIQFVNTIGDLYKSLYIETLSFIGSVSDSISKINMPEFTFEGMANFGSELATAAGEITTAGIGFAAGVGNSFLTFISQMDDYIGKAVNFIIQAPEQLKKIFLELPKLLIEAARQLPQLIDDITKQFPQIITDLMAELPNLLIEIAKKIPDFIFMIIEQIPIVIEKLSEALPEILLILIKNIPKFVGLILKSMINAVIGFVKGLGKGIMDLISGKKIKLDKIVDTKGLQNKIDKLSGETGKLFNVSDWTEAAQKPLDQIGTSISEAGKKGRDYLLEAGRWLDEKLWQPLGDIVRRAWSFVSNLWESLKDVVASAWQFVKNLWEGLKDAVAVAWQFVANLWEGLKDIVAGAWQMVSDLWENLKGAVAGAWQFVKDLWDGLSGAVSGAFQWVLDKVWTPLSELGQKIGDGFLNAIKGVGNFFSGIWEGFKNLFKFDFSGIGKAISGAFDSAMSGLRGVFAAVINPVVDVFNGLIGALNNLKIPGVSIKVPSWAGGGKWNLWDDIDLIPGNIGQLAKFAQGGLVQNGGMNLPGFGTDTVPAMLTPGEFVVSKRGVEGVGLGMLQAINQGSSPGSNNYNIEFNINIDAKTNVDEGYIRGTLIPRMQEEMKRASLDGKFVISSRGIR